MRCWGLFKDFLPVNKQSNWGCLYFPQGFSQVKSKKTCLGSSLIYFAGVSLSWCKQCSRTIWKCMQIAAATNVSLPTEHCCIGESHPWESRRKICGVVLLDTHRGWERARPGLNCESERQRDNPPPHTDDGKLMYFLIVMFIVYLRDIKPIFSNKDISIVKDPNWNKLAH